MRLLSLIQTLLLLLFFALGFSLSTCAPLPKEGEYKEEFQLTLQLQTRNSGRQTRTNSISKRKSEYVALVSETETIYSGKVTLGSGATPSTVSFSSIPAGSYMVFLFRYDQDLASFDVNDPTSQAIDWGRSQSPITVSSSSSTIQVTIQLLRETVFLDSPVEGLTYYTNSGMDNRSDIDGLIYYFPGEPINLRLGSLDLGNFTDPGPTLTPY
ncbi:MAG: hypothetical protein VXA48_10910, partial [Deltaproteobacteria bacterium]